MAYINTYTFKYSSSANIKYTLEIWDQGTNATTWANKKGTLGKKNCQISWGSENAKMYAPLKPSTLTIDFLVTDVLAANYLKQLRDNRQERDVYVYLYNTGTTSVKIPGDSPIFSGYLLMDLAEDPDVSVPYAMKLKAIDGLASLKYYDFIPHDKDQAADHLYSYDDTWLPGNTNSYNSFYPFRQWISRILRYSGYSTTTTGCSTDAEFQTSVNWFNGNMANTTGDPLDWTRATGDQFYKKEGDTGDIKYKPLTCYDALQSICKTWGMRCFVYKNTFYFIGINTYTEDNTGTLASPTNINWHRYTITGSSASPATGSALDLEWGRYYNPVYLTQANKKIAGSQYGVLPAFKKVSVDFLNVSNINYFQGFPKIPQPYPVTTGSGYMLNEETIGTFDFDGTNARTFFQEIYLDFQNNSGGDIRYECRWHIKAKKVGTGTWYQYGYPNWNGTNPFPGWFTMSGLSSTTSIFTRGHLIIPPGGSSFNAITDLINSSWYGSTFNQWVECPATVFTAGDWEFKYETVTEWFSGSQSIAYGHGRCDPIPWTGGTYNTDPDSNFITYTDSSITQGVGSSFFSPIANGIIGTELTNTQIVQAGLDTDFEEVTNVLWGDLPYGGAGRIEIYNGTGWQNSGFQGYWGVDSLTGQNSLAETLCEEIFKRQAQNVRKFSTKINLDALNYTSTDSSGTVPMYGTPFTRWFTPSHSGSATFAANWIMHSGSFDTGSDTWGLVLYEFETFNKSITTTTTGNNGDNSGGVGTNTGSGTVVPSQTAGGVGMTLANPARNNSRAIAKIMQNATRPISIITASQPLGGEGTLTVTSLTVQAIPNAILKSGDTVLVMCQYQPQATSTLDETNTIEYGNVEFVLSSDQSAGATTLSVVSKTIYQTLTKGDVVTISQPDLMAQYQNKTKGTVAGFGIDADGISKGGIEITDWLNSDTMSGAAVTNVPTALSVKNYVDAQVSATDSLQEVTTVGNTTTNSITIGNATSPSKALDVYGNADTGVAKFRHTTNGAYGSILLGSINYIYGDNGQFYWKSGSTELMRLKSNGNLLINTTNDYGKKFWVTGNAQIYGDLKSETFNVTNYATIPSILLQNSVTVLNKAQTSYISLLTRNTSGTEVAYDLTNVGAATFSGLVSGITPTVDANLTTKGYVDTQVASIPKGLSYQGTWNASTNTPTIVSSVGTAGYYWIVSVEGTTTIDGVSDWKVGDWIIFSDGGVYQKIDQSEGDTLQTVTTRGSTTTTGATFGGNLTLSGQTAPQLFLTSNTVGTPNYTLIADASSQFIIGRAGVSNDFILDSGNATFGGDIELGTGGYIYGDTTTPYLRLNNAAGTVLGYSTGNISIGPTFVYNTSSGEKFRINHSTGNVLIGINSDSGDKLQVAQGTQSLGFNAGILVSANPSDYTVGRGSGVTFKNADVNTGGIYGIREANNWTGSLTFYTHTSGVGNTFGSTFTEKMRLTSGGNLLIGTTADSGKTLYVNGTMQSSGEAFFSHFDNISNASRMRNDLKLWYNTDRTFGVYGNASKIAIYGNSTDMLSFDTSGNATFGGNVTLDGDGKLLKFTPSSYDDVELGIDSNGFVIYNTTDARYDLKISGDGNATFSGDVTVGDAYNTIYKNDGFTFTSNQDYNIKCGSTKILDLHFNEIKLYIGGSEKIRLDSTGLGIGTSSPVSKLNIVGSDNTSSKITITNTATSPDNTWSIHSNYNSQELIFTGDSTQVLSLNDNGTATFSGLVSGITPTADANFATKSYVDAQVGTADTLSEVLALGNTSGANDIAMALGQKVYFNNANENIYSNVNGDLQINARTELRIKANSNNASGNSLEFWNGGSEKMRLTSGGNILLGTTTDSGYKLDINGTTRITGELRIGSNINQYTGDFSVWVANVGQAFTIKPNTGNVGIGTVSPLAKMQVTAGSSGVSSVDTGTSAIIESNTTNYLRFVNPDDETGGLVWTSPSDNFAAFIRWKFDDRLLEIATAKTNSSIAFLTGNADERMRLDSTGLGIGTSSPSRLLTLENNTATVTNNSQLRINNTGSGDAYIYLYAGADWSIGVDNSDSDKFKICSSNDVSDGTEAITVDRSNNVGIGNTNPAAFGKFVVEGTGNLISLNSTSGVSKLGFFENGTGRMYLQSLSGSNGLAFIDGNNSTEQMRLSSNGALSIGNTNSTYKLNVGEGDVYINSASAAGGRGLYIQRNGATNAWSILQGHYGTNNLEIREGSDTRMKFLAGGNVGIGLANDTDPIRKLDTPNMVIGGSTIAGAYRANALFIDNNSGVSRFYSAGADGSTKGSYQFNIMASDANPLSTPLTLNSDDSATFAGDVKVSGNITGINSRNIVFEENATNYIYALGGSSSNLQLMATNSLRFNTSASQTERMRLTSDGNLLINTTTDDGSSKLQVDGDGLFGSASKTSATFLSIDSDSNNQAGIKLNRGGLTKWMIYNPAGTNNFQIYDNSGGASFTMEVGGAATFTGLVSGITPTADANFATKSYVDAQVGTADTLSEVLALGNTSGANDIIMANNQSYKGTHLNGSSVYGLLTLTSGNVIKMGGYDYTSAAVEIGCGDHAKFLIGSTEKMRLTSAGNVLIGTTTDSGKKLQVNGDIQVSNGSILVPQAYGINFGQSGYDVKMPSSTRLSVFTASTEKLSVLNNGNVLIGTTTDSGNAKLQVDGNAEVSGNTALGTTVSAVYRLDVNGKARVQSVLELDDVLTLNAIATPSDPANNKSSIWMATDGAIKCKINVNGTVVVRTLASFE